MSKLLERITHSRRLLQNPYAHLGDRGAYSALPGSGSARSLAEQIAESRRLLADPYAYLDGSGNFSALSDCEQLQATKRPHRYSNSELQQKAKELHKKIWQNKSQIWGDAAPCDPISMLDPSIALRLIGYDCDLDETLGQHRSNGGLIEVAGIIDSSSSSLSDLPPVNMR